MINAVTLGPYWDDGVLLVSFGESKKQLKAYVDDVHRSNLAEPGCLNKKHVRKMWTNWNKLFNQKELASRLDEVESKVYTTRGSVFYDMGTDYPCLLMVLGSDFDCTDYEDLITLAHECLHVCQRILPIYLTRDEEHEAEAYFHSHLMRKIIEMIK
jgi:hypothetical protein